MAKVRFVERKRDNVKKKVAMGLTICAAAFFAVTGSSFGAECVGDECQVPPPAPQEIVPPTASVQGAPNPPVHFPKPRKRHHHKHHRR